MSERSRQIILLRLVGTTFERIARKYDLRNASEARRLYFNGVVEAVERTKTLRESLFDYLRASLRT